MALVLPSAASASSMVGPELPQDLAPSPKSALQSRRPIFKTAAMLIVTGAEESPSSSRTPTALSASSPGFLERGRAMTQPALPQLLVGDTPQASDGAPALFFLRHRAMTVDGPELSRGRAMSEHEVLRMAGLL